MISPEAEALIASGPSDRDGLRKLAELLPADDGHLDRWLANAGTSHDRGTFGHLFCAAAMNGRKLRASQLSWAIMNGVNGWHIAWVAWRAEGDVVDALFHGLKIAKVPIETEAIVLSMAAACWEKERPGKELPRQIMRRATELSREKLIGQTLPVLQALGVLAGEDGFLAPSGRGPQAARARQEARRGRDRLMAFIEGPFEKLINERKRYDFISSEPQQRAVAKIGRNVICACGSGKKYKACCEKKDQERLRNSSSVVGVTRIELENDPQIPLTEKRLAAMGPSVLMNLDPCAVPMKLQAKYLLRLVELKLVEEAIAGLQLLAKDPDGAFSLPEHLREAWSQIFEYALEAWRPDVAKDLMEIFPDAEEKLGEKPHAGIRFLMTGHDLAKGMGELLDSIETLLKSRDLAELQKLVWALLNSPYYQGLGILLARSLLPLVDEKSAPGLFEGILSARADLNLGPEDEFSDWMDEHALRKSHQHETAAAQEAQDKLAAKMEELRAVKEEKARLERERDLHNRQERRESERLKTAPGREAEAVARNRELTTKIERLSALMSEGGKEKLELRRKLEETTRENEALKSGNGTGEPKQAKEDDDFEVPGNQPVRLLQFPLDFAETVSGVSRHVGRATMNRLGRLASGEPSAFHAIKQLKAYPEVLRARVSDKFRLLFCLTPDHVRVVDLIRRPDLDRRIERLQASGLPPIG